MGGRAIKSSEQGPEPMEGSLIGSSRCFGCKGRGEGYRGQGQWLVVGADRDRAAELRAPGRSGRMKPEDTRDARDNDRSAAGVEAVSQGVQAMTVTVQLPTELVESLRAVAERAGRDLDSTIASMLEEQLQ